ncbi:serine threonine protein kinase [Stylonychia lemnae]|uniref:Serine threonine protein kinase n=1 Tax=Stylonychia lemnae TaxID=5949 RepID=A0A078B9D2_STYLE|nr:serine threonine protein kinase [Stylonychia lemnae]|eukprot:CDW90826.1 serine threonine protein kinase [Stylonychia lemnae]
MLGKFQQIDEHFLQQEADSLNTLEYIDAQVYIQSKEIGQGNGRLIVDVNQIGFLYDSLIFRNHDQREQLQTYFTLSLSNLCFTKSNFAQNLTKFKLFTSANQQSTDSISIYVSSSYDEAFSNKLKINCIIFGRLENYFIISQFISEGSQASVYQAKSIDESNKNIYAIKQYDIQNQQQLKQIKTEVKFIRKLQIIDDEFFCRLHLVLQEQDKIYLVMDYFKNGDLSHLICQEKPLTESQIKNIMSQLLLSTYIMHSENIIHRDLKPENILLINSDSLKVSVTDLGLACLNNDYTNKNKKCGSPGFMAPEILRDQSFDLNSDIFSLGCIMFALIAKKYIFPAQTLQKLILQNQYAYPSDLIDKQKLEVSQECIELMKLMLGRNQNMRPSAEKCLQHIWFHEKKQYILDKLLKIKLKNSSKIREIYSFNAINSGFMLKSTNLNCCTGQQAYLDGLNQSYIKEEQIDQTQLRTGQYDGAKFNKLCKDYTNINSLNNSQKNLDDKLCMFARNMNDLDQKLQDIEEERTEEQTPRLSQSIYCIDQQLKNRRNLSQIIREQRGKMSNLNSPVKIRILQ